MPKEPSLYGTSHAGLDQLVFDATGKHISDILTEDTIRSVWTTNAIFAPTGLWNK
jgi:hypothetical protein